MGTFWKFFPGRSPYADPCSNNMAWAYLQMAAEQYLSMLSTVMNTDPSVIRRLRLSLPVAFDIDQSDEKNIAIADKSVSVHGSLSHLEMRFPSRSLEEKFL